MVLGYMSERDDMGWEGPLHSIRDGRGCVCVSDVFWGGGVYMSGGVTGIYGGGGNLNCRVCGVGLESSSVQRSSYISCLNVWV